MLKRIITFLFLLFVSTAVFIVGCSDTNGPEDISSDTSFEDVVEKGYIAVGIYESMPPLSYVDRSGEITGFDIAVVEEIATRLNLELKVISINQEGLSDLKDGTIDMINGQVVSSGDQKELSFSLPYIESEEVFMVRRDSEIQTKEELLDKKIGIISTKVQVIESDEVLKTKAEDLVLFEQEQEAISELGIGKLDALIVEETVARNILVNKPAQFKIILSGLSKHSYGFGFRANNQSLKEEIDTIIMEMKDDGTLLSLSKEWFGDNLISE